MYTLKSQTIDKKTFEKVLTVVLDGEEWTKLQDKAFKTLASKLSIKGFRKGKVPVNKAKELISEAQIFQEATKSITSQFISFADENITGDEIILSEPTLTLLDINKDKVEVNVIYPIFPEIKLSSYDKLGVKYPEIIVDDSDVKISKEKLLSAKSEKVESNDPIEKGDFAVFDFKGFIDGKAFEGGEAEGYELMIGSQQFIPGFEDQMIGLKAGDEKDIHVTFPENYHMKDYASKEAIFKVKIIKVIKVKTPELTEEFIKTLEIPKVTTESELESYLKDLIYREKEQKQKAQFQKDVFDKIIEKSDIYVHPQLIENEKHRLRQRFEQSLKEQSFNLDEYLQLTKLTREDIDKQLTEEAIRIIKVSLASAEIAKLENLEVTEEEYEKQYEKIATVYGMTDLDLVKRYIPKQNLQQQLLTDKVINTLIAKQK